MEDITLGFVAFPALLAFIGSIFAVIFARDILRWFSDTRSLEAAARGYASVAQTEGHELPPGYEHDEPLPQYRAREKVLVGK